MALIVEWTEEAESQLERIIEYLEENWTDREVRNFFTALERGLKIISSKCTTLLHSNRLCEVSWLIHVASAHHSNMVGQ